MMQATATIEAPRAADFAEKSPVPSRPVQWRRAGKAFRALTRQEGDVLAATYSVVDAMGGMCEERLFQRFRKTPEGQRLLAERPDLPRILTDHQTLAQLPEGTVGRIFADVCIRAGINSMGRVGAQPSSPATMPSSTLRASGSATG